MSYAKKNDKVKVHYTGRLNNGEQFDSSEGREPLKFVVGDGQMIKGFDEAVEGMEINEKITVVLEPENAYGPVFDQLINRIERTSLPEDMNPELGQELVATAPDGTQTRVQVTAVDADSITVDANHPLAGKELTFDIELVEISA
jgi:FKBP-type peptidyl-prolyl cis-trans isomerase 2